LQINVGINLWICGERGVRELQHLLYLQHLHKIGVAAKIWPYYALYLYLLHLLYLFTYEGYMEEGRGGVEEGHRQYPVGGYRRNGVAGAVGVALDDFILNLGHILGATPSYYTYAKKGVEVLQMPKKPLSGQFCGGF